MIDDDTLVFLENAREHGKKIGLVQGSWDLFHIGHLRYLQAAKDACDILVVGVDSDEKIRKRKGEGRPIIPEGERMEFIQRLGVADAVVLKPADAPKWALIKRINPDVLICIAENYTDDEATELLEYCDELKVLPRQASTSTSDKIRKILISNGVDIHHYDPTELRDEYCPVVACCKWEGEWVVGTNIIDTGIMPQDIHARSELFYNTVEHAEINLLKKLDRYVQDLGKVIIHTTLFPCDRCMKVLIDKGVKEIHYIYDHPEKGWSKRSHKLAQEYGVHTVCTSEQLVLFNSKEPRLGNDEIPTWLSL